MYIYTLYMYLHVLIPPPRHTSPCFNGKSEAEAEAEAEARAEADRRKTAEVFFLFLSLSLSSECVYTKVLGVRQKETRVTTDAAYVREYDDVTYAHDDVT